MGNLTSFLPPQLRQANASAHHKAYYIAMLTVHDKEEFNKYLNDFSSIAEKFQGKAIAQTTDLASPEGSFADHAQDFHRCFVMEFPSIRKAQDWYKSDEYQAIKELRTKSSSGPVTIAACNDEVTDSMMIHHSKHKALVVAFAKAPPVPHEEDGPMLGPSLKHYHGNLILNCALSPQHFALPNKAIAFEEKEEKQDYDICYLISFPTMEDAKGWRGSDAYVHLDGPLVALSLLEKK